MVFDFEPQKHSNLVLFIRANTQWVFVQTLVKLRGPSVTRDTSNFQEAQKTLTGKVLPCPGGDGSLPSYQLLSQQ